MGIFNLFKKKEEPKKKVSVTSAVGLAQKGREARQKFNALPIELSRPRPYRVAQRLMRLYSIESNKEVLKSIKSETEKLRAFGFKDTPTSYREAQALVGKIKKDRQEK